jgi:ferritin-like metal-binding protein YciE
MTLSNLKDLFIDELRDLYSAENQLVKALPKMAKAATARPLKNGFTQHLKQTRRHVDRLGKVFETLEVSPRGKTCKAMQALIAEGDELMSEDAEADVMDAGLIAAAQRVEHYEIAGYGCVRTYARLLGYKSAATLLQQTLKEEGDTDKRLTRLSEKINVQAEEPDRRKTAAKKTAAKRRQRPIVKRIREAVGL